MADYLSSCNKVGGALRNEAGECLDVADDFADRICHGPWCSGCSYCASDACDLLMETECVMNSLETSEISDISLEGCRVASIVQGDNYQINYFTYYQRGEVCRGYASGSRFCNNVVAAQTVNQTIIDSCLGY